MKRLQSSPFRILSVLNLQVIVRLFILFHIVLLLIGCRPAIDGGTGGW